MQALKALIIGMGLLILAGFGVVGVTLYNRATAPEDSGGKAESAGDAAPDAATGAGAETKAPLPSFGLARLGLPAGSRVVETTAEGGRLMLRVRDPAGAETIHVIDLATGARLGTIEITGN